MEMTSTHRMHLYVNIAPKCCLVQMSGDCAMALVTPRDNISNPKPLFTGWILPEN